VTDLLTQVVSAGVNGLGLAVALGSGGGGQLPGAAYLGLPGARPPSVTRGVDLRAERPNPAISSA